MATLTYSAQLGNNLHDMLASADIQPGDNVSYQLCKTIYVYHPMGKRIVDAPIEMAMSKPRTISVPDSPEDLVTEAFVRTWSLMNCDYYIAMTQRHKRIYGIATLSYDVDAINPATITIENPDGDKFKRADVIPPEMLSAIDPIFHVFDPLNTAGSLVLNQNPRESDFMRPMQPMVSGERIAPSRCVVVMNEDPIYLEFTASAFGFVGRSVYQRALYPLKSYIQSMVTDNLVQEKAGVLVLMMKQAGSIVDSVMKKAAKLKADLKTVDGVGHDFGGPLAQTAIAALNTLVH